MKRQLESDLWHVSTCLSLSDPYYDSLFSLFSLFWSNLTNRLVFVPTLPLLLLIASPSVVSTYKHSTAQTNADYGAMHSQVQCWLGMTVLCVDQSVIWLKRFREMQASLSDHQCDAQTAFQLQNRHNATHIERRQTCRHSVLISVRTSINHMPQMVNRCVACSKSSCTSQNIVIVVWLFFVCDHEWMIVNEC